MDGLELDFRGDYNLTGGGVGAIDLPSGRPNVRFYARSVEVPFRTREQGYPAHRNADYVHVAFPGERDEIDREATPLDKRRWAREFAAYEAGRMDLPDGMPIAALFPVNQEVVDLLTHSKVHTVEQLAEMSDTAIQGLGMGGSEWQARAKRFLALSKDASRMGAIERKQLEQDKTQERLAEDNEALRAKIAELEAAAEKKGRKALVTEPA